MYLSTSSAPLIHIYISLVTIFRYSLSVQIRWRLSYLLRPAGRTPATEVVRIPFADARHEASSPPFADDVIGSRRRNDHGVLDGGLVYKPQLAIILRHHSPRALVFSSTFTLVFPLIFLDKYVFHERLVCWL